MSELEDKCKCIIIKNKCECEVPVTFYTSFGREKVIEKMCTSVQMKEFAKLVDVPEYGIYKLCRRELYKEIGKVGI